MAIAEVPESFGQVQVRRAYLPAQRQRQPRVPRGRARGGPCAVDEKHKGGGGQAQEPDQQEVVRAGGLRAQEGRRGGLGQGLLPERPLNRSTRRLTQAGRRGLLDLVAYAHAPAVAGREW